jgi:dsDNA-specific endonuclease/ATPase MutS2
MKQILLGLVLFIVSFGYAQQIISGTVTSANDGVTVPFVNVLVKNITQGTTTDIDGNYSIILKSENNILVFSALGYTTQEILVNDQTSINIILEEGTTALKEIVITALNRKRETKELGYAIQSINGKGIAEVK